MRFTLTTLVTMLCLLAFAPAAWAADVVDTKPFAELLEKYVDGRGRVDYAGLKDNAEDKAKLDAFADVVATAKVEGSDSAKLAFYINAYNATVIKSIVDKYPIESVMKVKGFFKAEKHAIAGQQVTLDALENEIVRKQFAEARIHFVLVCGAKSCPRLQRKVATEKNLEKLLDGAAREFVPKATKVENGTVTTSQLFNWFKDDFVKAEGSVKKYLAKYDPEHAAAILADDSKLAFSDYSWKLNKQRTRSKNKLNKELKPAAPAPEAAPAVPEAAPEKFAK